MSSTSTMRRPPPWPWHPSPSAWKHLARGEPSHAAARRLASHLLHCERCQQHYQRLLLGARLLESGDASRPAEGELALLRLAGPEKILSAVASTTPARRPTRPHLVAAVGALAMVCALVGLPRDSGPSPHPARSALGAAPEQLVARGAEGPLGVLRIFCWWPADMPEGRTEELAEGESCGEDGTLVFAAAARLPEAFLVLRLEGPSPTTWGPFHVQAWPGSEEVLAKPTLALRGHSSPLRFVAAFADRPEEALRRVEAPEEKAHPLIRRTVHVAPGQSR